MANDRRDLVTALVTGEAVPGQELSEDAERAKAVAKWGDEIRSAKKFFEPFHTQAKTSVERYLDDSTTAKFADIPSYKLNLYYSNITTLKAMLYAQLPKVEADRRFFDPSDDVARVAAEIVTRILQNDMNDPADTLDTTLKAALEDRLLTALGTARVRYEMEEGPADPPVMGEDGKTPLTAKTDEWCDLVYTHWKDILWNPSRVIGEHRWRAFRAYMTKDEVTKRFGAAVAAAVPYAKQQTRVAGSRKMDLESTTPEAEIWEIWSLENKRVYWWCEGYTQFLDEKDDPLELSGFFPDARPMLGNTTTTKCLPKPDFTFAKDLYDEIDELESRIALLTKAAKAVGVYDRSSKDVGRVMDESVENQLIPVDNWAMFAEKGGLRGVVDWLPIEAIVNAVQVLSGQQTDRINKLFQVTGMSDIMRGQATQTNVTATEQRIKAQFGSARIQQLQEEFATFAADLLNLKVQLIQKLYDPQRILQLSNIMSTPDAQFAEQAVQLIKTPGAFNARIAVRSESMAQANQEAIRGERTELLQGVAQFIGMAQPMIEAMPEAAPFLLQLLQFGVSGFKGASEMEGVIDQAVAGIQKSLEAKAQQPPAPDPEVVKAQQEAQTAQMEAQQKAQQSQQDHAADMAKLQAELQMDRERFQLDVQKARLDLQQSQQEHALRMEELRAKLEATIVTAQVKAEAATQKAADDRAAAKARPKGDE